ATQLPLGTAFRPELLEQAKKSLQDLYTNNGFYDSAVDFQTSDDPNHEQINITVLAKPGPRARYVNPVIRGDTKLSESTIIRATRWRVPVIGRWRQVTESLTRRGIDGIEKKYQGKDRLTAAVDLASLDYDPEVIRARATLDINAGPKIQVKAVE